MKARIPTAQISDVSIDLRSCSFLVILPILYYVSSPSYCDDIEFHMQLPPAGRFSKIIQKSFLQIEPDTEFYFLPIYLVQLLQEYLVASGKQVIG